MPYPRADARVGAREGAGGAVGRIGKQVLKHYAENECERQTLLDVGADDPRWLSPPRPIARADARRVTGFSPAELGRAYERAVYAVLARNRSARARELDDPAAGVGQTALTAAKLRAYAHEFAAPDGPTALILLEHEWPTPPRFARSLFDLPADAPDPVTDPLGTMRPDILVMRRPEARGLAEVLPDGALRELSSREASTRAALEVIDIKHTHEQGVGSTHFIELHYYALALSAFIHDNHLSSEFFVSSENHGIIPRRELHELAALRYDEPRALAVPLSWRDTAHVFEAARKQLVALKRRAPLAVEESAPRIQRACGHCSYLPDCTASLQRGSDPRSWDVALIPFLQQGVAEQLRARGLDTVGAVAERVRSLPQGETPTPVDAEVPSLELKARALLAGAVLPATPENTAGERMLSIALPRFTDAELYFDIETDPTNEVVFAAGLLWSVGTAPGGPYRAAHDAWWSFWRDHLEVARAQRRAGHKSAVPVDVAGLVARIDSRVLEEAKLDEAGLARVFEAFSEALLSLDAVAGASLEITDVAPSLSRKDHEERVSDDGARTPFQVQWRLAYVNGGSKTGGTHHDGERALAERLVGCVARVVRVSLSYETFVANPVDGTNFRGEASTWFQRPSFAVFHWSREQISHIEDLLERHLQHFVGGPERANFLALLDWVAPSESGVSNAQQHLKVFDLREFVETSFGHPEIINVTWHGVDARLDPMRARSYSARYWAPHFNYMDFAVWHEYLNESDSNAQEERRQGIRNQIARKLWALQRILRRSRRDAGEGIAKSHQRPVASSALTARVAPKDHHAIALLWVMFSRLGAAVQELDGQYTRTTYPLQSIAKLAAAEATGVSWDAHSKRFFFDVRGLSANVNMKEGDYALLVPESLRNASGARRCSVILLSMVWDAALPGYRVEARDREGMDGQHPCFEDPPAEDTRWFLYPAPSDSWTGPLQKLLARKGFGTSWLGRRLSALWRIGMETSLERPSSLSFQTPEVYLYAPGVLPTTGASGALQTTQHPPPDPSQTEAIHASLGQTVSCIQGPPGTGKSQTIAALIDEFLLRRKGMPARVLVTAFSYPAMRVVLDKVRAAVDVKGQPTEAARTRLVWLRAEGREKIPDEAGLPHVTDVVPSGIGAKIDETPLDRRNKQANRLDLALGDRFVFFANAHSLAKLGTPSKSASFEYELLSNGFGFDLIIIDEASQVPVSQLVASLALVRPHPLTLAIEGEAIDDKEWPIKDPKRVAALSLSRPPDADALTKVVIVGDHNQLPPVQPVEAPEKLKRILDSAFGYFVQGHAVPFQQLRRNYRSKPTIVEYTSRLGIYSAGLEAFRAEHPYAPLPPPPTLSSEWLRRVLDDGVDVSTLIHSTQHETAVSPLEARISAALCLGFFEQMGVTTGAHERRFWSEELGIVAPHNAQGRLVTRAIYEALTRPDARRTTLDDEELMRCLRGTIYSVEKFQGSDRTFILGTVAISSRDQLAAEEAFIYDLNRFNVLTSRAKQKMVLLCSQAFLDYVPRDREVFSHAARVRDFAYGFCDQSERFSLEDETELTWRYRV